MLARGEGDGSEGKGSQAEICVWKRQQWSRKQMDRKVQKQQGLELIQHRSRGWVTCFSAEPEIIEISVYLKSVHLIKAAVDSPVLSSVVVSRCAEHHM